MLRSDVVEAVRKGDFNVWTIQDLDQGVKYLMDKTAVQLRKSVEIGLEKYARSSRAFVVK